MSEFVQQCWRKSFVLDLFNHEPTCGVMLPFEETIKVSVSLEFLLMESRSSSCLATPQEVVNMGLETSTINRMMIPKEKSTSSLVSVHHLGAVNFCGNPYLVIKIFDPITQN